MNVRTPAVLIGGLMLVGCGHFTDEQPAGSGAEPTPEESVSATFRPARLDCDDQVTGSIDFAAGASGPADPAEAAGSYAKDGELAYVTEQTGNAATAYIVASSGDTRMALELMNGGNGWLVGTTTACS